MKSRLAKPTVFAVEQMVYPAVCAKMLGVEVGMISAAKRQMGIARRKVFPSEMEKFFKKNRGFKKTDVYHYEPKAP